MGAWGYWDEVRKFREKFVLVSPTLNSGEKERVHIQNFVLTGCSNVHVDCLQGEQVGNFLGRFI